MKISETFFEVSNRIHFIIFFCRQSYTHVGNKLLVPMETFTFDAGLSAEADSTSVCQSEDVYTEHKTHSRTSSYLPPCRICRKKASGFHYGVNTCEACKVSLYMFVCLVRVSKEQIPK